MMKFDIHVMVGAAFVLSLMILDGEFSFGEGIICILMLSIYLTVMIGSNDGAAGNSDAARATLWTWLVMLASAVLIFLGAKYTVDSVIAIAEKAAAMILSGSGSGRANGKGSAKPRRATA